MYGERIDGRDVIVVDMTHGGIQLCEAYTDAGAKVHAVDVHGTLSSSDAKLLGAPVYRTFKDAVRNCDPELIALQYSPDREMIRTYCGELGVPLLSHARATGLLLTKHLKNKEVIEITGDRGKSSVISLLSKVFDRSGRKCLVMSSQGIIVHSDEGQETLDSHGSITPANALKAISLLENSNQNVDTYVFEISLGGMGVGSVAAVIGIPLHLRVGIMRSAFFSKAQMAEHLNSDSILCLNSMDAPTKRLAYLTDAQVNTYACCGEQATVTSTQDAVYPDASKIDVSVSKLAMVNGKKLDTELSFEVNPRFFGISAVSNVLAASSIALSVGVSIEDLQYGIEHAIPIENRLVSTPMANGTIIESTATSKEVIMHSISEAQNYSSRINAPLHLLVGGKERTTCGSLDFSSLAKELASISASLGSMNYFGELGRRLNDKGAPGRLHATESEALRSLSKEVKMVVILCKN